MIGCLPANSKYLTVRRRFKHHHQSPISIASVAIGFRDATTETLARVCTRAFPCPIHTGRYTPGLARAWPALAATGTPRHDAPARRKSLAPALHRHAYSDLDSMRTKEEH